MSPPVQIKWDEIFESVDDMILGIQSIHYIMFEQFDEMKRILNDNDVFNMDIVTIIVEYLWVPLPTIDNIDMFEPIGSL